MKKLIEFFNKASEIVFGLASVAYLFLAFVEIDPLKSNHFIIMALLTLITCEVLTIRHKQEKLNG